MKVFPADVVDAVIAQCGRTERRRRSLPARSMAYFAMGMALQSEGSGRLANKAAISHARTGWVRSRWRCCSTGSRSRWRPSA
jgi:hypothetical protein